MSQKSRVALFSVFDKEKIKTEDFVRPLQEMGWKIIGSKGTVEYLAKFSIQAQNIADFVGGDPILEHRVVTLSREIHAGLLAKEIQSQLEELERLGIQKIDLVFAEFYPLEETIKKGGTFEQVIESTGIGGPAMSRSGAKGNRIVICDPADQLMVINWLKAGEPDREEFINNLAAKAEMVVAKYCLLSANFRSKGRYAGFILELARQLAYAENKDQDPAYLLSTQSDDPLAMDKFEIKSGNPSYISMADASTLIEILALLHQAMVLEYGKAPYIVVAGKHGNPCGAAISFETPQSAILKALLGDPVAVMGGEVVTNFPITDELGQLLFEVQPELKSQVDRDNWGLDIILAPEFSEGSIALLGKRERRRLLSNPAMVNPQLSPAEWMCREVRGGFLKQKAPKFILTRDNIQEWVGQSLNDKEFASLLVAWAVCWRAASNTVAFAKDGMLIGLGCGQQDRIACVRLCLEKARKAGHDTNGAVFASDGFFPYAKSDPADLSDLEVIYTTLQAALKMSDLKLVDEVFAQIRARDKREGTQLLADAGCIGGVVPADGKNLEEVKKFFLEHGLRVAFVAPEHRGFSKH